MTPPRLLIEDWLPAAAIGVECMRERGSASALAPTTYLHVWWARRPLTVSRAAVLGSLLPADFPRDVFERLLGFWGSSRDIVAAQRHLDAARARGERIENPHLGRAFKRGLRDGDLALATQAYKRLWKESPTVIDPMAGGGSIPLEAARLGLASIANEYNPVACTVLEATVDYPFRYGKRLCAPASRWAAELRTRFNARMERFFPKTGVVPPHCFIFARTVPCPDTQHHTPLVPDWHLLKPKGSKERLIAEPVVDKKHGTWSVRIRPLGKTEPSRPTYDDGKGISLFSGNLIPADYIKAKAQAGEMKSALYAIALKTPRGLEFVAPKADDLEAIDRATKELKRLRPGWERDNILPTEAYPEVSSDERPRTYGMPLWVDMFAPRQLLGFGVIVEELKRLRPEVIKAEGDEVGEAVLHLLAFAIDKFLNYNSLLASWHAPRAVMRSVFDRHDFSFKPTFAEMAPCGSGTGLAWAIDNTLESYEALVELPRAAGARPATISLGSATSLPQFDSGSMTAVVVDPPYDDNVQYSELADFFYVWLKRTQGHRRPEWFSTYLCDHSEEAVVNVSRFRDEKPKKKGGKRDGSAGEAKAKARAFYRDLMQKVFRESRRILRDDGALTVMFTHKKQEAWEALFDSLIQAGFSISATWPVKTESEHSLHQAKKNAAQSTVILVARKRRQGAGVGFFDSTMRKEIRDKARASAVRLQKEGLNAVDQLVGSFGPAMEVFSRFDAVKTDQGDPVPVGEAIDEASAAVSLWREEQLAARGLDGVEPEGKFALLCWDVLQAEEFRFNEASLLGKAVGIDVDQLISAGLVTKSSEKIRMLSAKDRRRDRALEPDEIDDTLFGPVSVSKKQRKSDVLKVHPNDPKFRTAIDACHALALRYLEAGGGGGGVGSAKALVRSQHFSKDSSVARLMEALVSAAPEAVRHDKGKKSAAARFPEFRAWHALLEPLFSIEAPDWTEPVAPQPELLSLGAEDEGEEEDSEDQEE